MPVQLKKAAVDLGIITNNPEPMLAFYRDLLGFHYEGALDVGGTTMHRLWCGDSLIKILQHKAEIPQAPTGGMTGATGYRYWTMTVDNLDEITAACEEAGYGIAMPLTDIRPGVRISVVEDPDGNWVEFLENS